MSSQRTAADDQVVRFDDWPHQLGAQRAAVHEGDVRKLYFSALLTQRTPMSSLVKRILPTPRTRMRFSVSEPVHVEELKKCYANLWVNIQREGPEISPVILQGPNLRTAGPSR